MTSNFQRFTPTCVGKAHRTAQMRLRAAGSPPRAWGRRRIARQRGSSWRFTPTCVGKAVVLAAIFAAVTVHPHVRGEGETGLRPFARMHGSPPRAWGRHRAMAARGNPHRFTPTCVGKAKCRILLKKRHSVHPHVRGEGRPHDAGNAAVAGSPPRAWGRLALAQPRHQPPRFTPTCVGKAARRCSPHRRLPVHPHVRGEGSVLRAADRGRTRFTPTCVGKAARPSAP